MAIDLLSLDGELYKNGFCPEKQLNSIQEEPIYKTSGGDAEASGLLNCTYSLLCLGKVGLRFTLQHLRCNRVFPQQIWNKTANLGC